MARNVGTTQENPGHEERFDNDVDNDESGSESTPNSRPDRMV